MTWILFATTAAVIVVGGVYLARYGDLIGERSGLGRTWTGMVLLAATTSVPELFTGFGATAVTPLPDIAVGDVVGSCMFNLLILSLMDAIQPDRLSARAHQGHVMAIGFGLLLMGVAGLGLAVSPQSLAVGWIGLYSPILIVVYFAAVRVTSAHDRQRRATDAQEAARPIGDVRLTLRMAVARYVAAASFVIAGALYLPILGADLAASTGLGQAFVGSLFVAVTTSLPEIVVSVSAVRMGALDLGISNVLGSNLFNLLILGLDDVFYTRGPLLGDAGDGHLVGVLAVILMNALFLIGLTQQVLTKRFRVAWDTGAMALVYGGAVWLVYVMRG